MLNDNGWHLLKENPEKCGHYLVLSDFSRSRSQSHKLTWEDIARPEAPAGTTLTVRIAYYTNQARFKWNDPHAVAWHEIPAVPQDFIDRNQAEFRLNNGSTA